MQRIRQRAREPERTIYRVIREPVPACEDFVLDLAPVWISIGADSGRSIGGDVGLAGAGGPRTGSRNRQLSSISALGRPGAEWEHVAGAPAHERMRRYDVVGPVEAPSSGA